jgi:hypothetical protein
MNRSYFLNISAAFLAALLFSSLSSCKKDDKCEAGSGGSVTLILEPEHHGEPIYSQPTYRDSAFIKFDAEEFPGDDPAKYDIIVVGQSGSKQVTVSGLKCGKYYLFMTGFDTSIVERVKGGIPYEFDEEDGVKTVKVPVTED